VQGATELVFEPKLDLVGKMALDKANKEGSLADPEVTIEFPMALATEVLDPCCREAWDAIHHFRPLSGRACKWCSDLRSLHRGFMKIFGRQRATARWGHWSAVASWRPDEAQREGMCREGEGEPISIELLLPRNEEEP
jgi:hypothetical protein